MNFSDANNGLNFHWKLPGMKHTEFFRADGVRAGYPKHLHESFVIDVILAGQCMIQCGGSQESAGPGYLVLLNPAQIHTVCPEGRAEVSYRSIYVSGDFSRRIAAELGYSENLRFIQSGAYNLRLAERITKCHFIAEKLPSDMESEALLLELLIELFSVYGNLRSCPNRKVSGEHYAVGLVTGYLQERYAERINLKQLSDLTDLNSSYLLRIFRSQVGLPPHAYLMQIRIDKARHLLSRGVSIAETALAVGFSDQSHLTRSFKRTTGFTPAQYAQMRNARPHF